MNRLFIYINALFILLFVLTGCESSDNKNEYELNETMVVTGRSYPFPNSPDGDLIIFNGRKYNVVVTDSTSISYMRPSCSGYSNGGIDDVHVGDTLEFDIDYDRVEFVKEPPEVRPSYIRVTPPECMPSINDYCEHRETCPNN